MADETVSRPGDAPAIDALGPDSLIAHHLHLTQPASDDLQGSEDSADGAMLAGDALDGDLVDERPSLDSMLEEIPLGVELAVDLDHLADFPDPDDPALTASGRRFCIATRRAGGRCTAPPGIHSLLCTAHSGLLDASAGGKAKAERHHEAQTSAAERSRLAALGTRGVIRDTLAANAVKVRRVVQLLLDDAAGGDLSSAKALLPYLNQGLGMPTETVQTLTPQSAADLEAMPTEALTQHVASLKAARDARREASEAAETA